MTITRRILLEMITDKEKAADNARLDGDHQLKADLRFEAVKLRDQLIYVTV